MSSRAWCDCMKRYDQKSTNAYDVTCIFRWDVIPNPGRRLVQFFQKFDWFGGPAPAPRLLACLEGLACMVAEKSAIGTAIALPERR